MSHLQGFSLWCAQGGGLPEHPRPPTRVCFDFLGQRVALPYYRAFAGDYLNRTQLAALVHRHIQAAVAAAGWPADWAAEGAVLLGSTAHSIAEHEQRWQDGVAEPGRYTLHEIADQLMSIYGYAPPYCLATSCTSAAHALLQAHRLIAGGAVARAVVVGVESFNRISLMHFHSVGLLGQECRPFAVDGLILGEGIAALALAAVPAAGSLHLVAAAVNTDAASLTDTSSDSLAAVTREALRQAGVDSADVRLVKAHAVGSAGSDAAEMAALSAVFGEPPPLAVFKPLTGHTLGASAAIETALLYQALQAGVLPAVAAWPAVAVPLDAGCYVSQFSGFGGSNVGMVWQWST